MPGGRSSRSPEPAAITPQTFPSIHRLPGPTIRGSRTLQPLREHARHLDRSPRSRLGIPIGTFVVKPMTRIELADQLGRNSQPSYSKTVAEIRSLRALETLSLYHCLFGNRVPSNDSLR